MPYPDRLPTSSECPEFFFHYIRELPEGSLPRLMKDVRRELLEVLDALEAKDWQYRYAKDKWSVAQLVGHLTDCERVFQFRALHFARAAEGELPGMEEDDWARISHHHQLEPALLLAELQQVRAATDSLYALFNEEDLWRSGRANQQTMTAGAIAWAFAGHEIHHTRVLRERYRP